ncbi:RdgB/HAM1 family non-canonical purine NTP pyrophosphatase [Marinobacteraceae bacterium S3BR75-40.1]
MTERRLVLASNNTGKLAELQSLLSPLGWTLIPQGELGIPPAEEPASTFVENALIKARHASRVTGLPALADDSGLAVDALDGAPGVYSARFAGPEARDADNNRKLLDALAETPAEERGAQFHCVLALLRHAEDPIPLICHGRWAGRILEQPAGEGGFGYDPLFYAPEHQCSAAQLSREAKGAISHRGKALRQLVERLRDELP